MKRFMTYVLAAATIVTLSEVAQASPPGGRGHEGERYVELHHGSGYGRPSHEYERGSHFWSRSFYCSEFGCYIYWNEQYRWWYRYDEGRHKYQPLEKEYRPNP